jgi:2-hydroxychromene-2-carboxylate isomerase
MPRRIDYYFSLASPWSYLGHAEFIRIASENGAGVNYKPVALGKVFPETGGLPLAKRHPARQAYRLVELQRWREKRKIGLKLAPKFWPFDQTLADQLIIALAASGAAVESFLPYAFAAVFDHERNLADETVLSALLGEAKLDAAALLARAKSEATKNEYTRFGEEAIAAGVFGAPSYVLDGEIFWGQDRLSLLEEALKSGRAPYLSAV